MIRTVKDIDIGILPLQLNEEGQNVLTEVIGKKEMSKARVLLRSTGAAGCAVDMLKGLTVLQLDGASLMDDTATFLAEALKENTDVTELLLGNNKITRAGAEAIAEMLKQNSAIRKLDLSNNRIETDGLDAILKTLKQHNGTLEDLQVVNAGLTRLSDVLAEVVNTHGRLRVVNCLQNDLDSNSKTIYGQGGKVVVDQESDW